MEKMVAAVTFNMTEPYKSELIGMCKDRCELRFLESAGELANVIGDTDVILGPAPANAGLFANARKLKWLQSNSVGVESLVKIIKNMRGVVLTNASGAYGQGISEYMIAYVLIVLKKMREYMRAQENHEWPNSGMVKMIEGSRVTVVGLGNLGGTFARKMHLLGARVRGVDLFPTPKPDYLDAIYPIDRLDEALEGADIAALCVPDTPQTAGLFTRERIFAMKQDAILINVGRGGAVDQDALCDALKEKRIYAGLDVMSPEPLPKDHPLWDMENLVMTPHIAGGLSSSTAPDFISGLIVRNMRAFLDGKPLENVVNLDLGF